MVEFARKYRSFIRCLSNVLWCKNLLCNLVFFRGNGFTCNRSSKHNGKPASCLNVETLCKNLKKKSSYFYGKPGGGLKTVAG